MGEYLAIPEEIYSWLTTSRLEKIPMTIQGLPYMLVSFDELEHLYIGEEAGSFFRDLYGSWVDDLRQGLVKKKTTEFEGVYVVVPVKSQAKPQKQKTKNEKTKKGRSLEDKYVNFCGTRNLKALSARAEKDIAKIGPKIIKLQEELIKAIRYLSDRQRALESIKNGKTLDENLRIEFQKLRSHPDIDQIVINKDSIAVKTKPICINYKGKDYLVGQFKITIYGNGKNGGIMIENLTNIIRNEAGYYMHHPHIRAKTKKDVPFVCLGNIQETIATLVGERQYPALISICIEYLKSYNDDDSFAEPPTSWKEKRK